MCFCYVAAIDYETAEATVRLNLLAAMHACKLARKNGGGCAVFSSMLFQIEDFHCVPCLINPCALVQVKNLDEMNLTDEEKMSLTLEVLKVTREMLEAGHDVDDLISHGIDLIAILLPKTSNCQELR